MNVQSLRIVLSLHIFEANVEVSLQELVDFEEFWNTGQPRKLEQRNGFFSFFTRRDY